MSNADAAAPTRAIQPLPAAFGKFVLERRLARGGMADVYLARLQGAAGFEKELVVKLIRPELSSDEAFVGRFVDEAKTCVRLSHPNIVSIFELGVEHGVLYIVMELVRGASLHELLLEGGPLRPEEGVYVGLEVARALDHAHRRGVIHRDVTPGNVMIDDVGAVKLLDFGIAAPVDREGTVEGEVFGTPGHMPPEQSEGRALGPPADLFALGTVLVEAWTGRAPFRRADPRACRSAMAAGAPPLPSIDHPDLASLDDLVAALVAVDPDRRPQHADDVARRLRGWLLERSLDLDEIARTLTTRVARGIAAREARMAGRPAAPTPIARSIRPTPLAEGTRTFATRGAPDAWSEPPRASRALERAPGVDAGVAASDPPATRRVEEPSTAAAPATRPILAQSGPEAARPSHPPSWGSREEREEGRRPNRRTSSLMVAALVVLVCVGSIFGVQALMRRPGPPTAAAVPSTTTSSAGPPRAVEAPATSTSAAPVAQIPSTSSSTVEAPTAAPARLVFASSPPAQIELDGRAIGVTPLTITASAGEHRILLRPRGLDETFERRVQLASGTTTEIRGDFNDEPRIVVRTTPR